MIITARVRTAAIYHAVRALLSQRVGEWSLDEVEFPLIIWTIGINLLKRLSYHNTEYHRSCLKVLWQLLWLRLYVGVIFGLRPKITPTSSTRPRDSERSYLKGLWVSLWLVETGAAHRLYQPH